MAEALISPDNRPPTITPADGVADGFRIPEYFQCLRHERVFKDGTTKVLGHWHDRVEIIQKYGRPALRREQTASCIGIEDWQQTLLVDRATIAPYSSVMHSGDFLHNRVLYDNDIIHITRHIWPEGFKNEEPTFVNMVLTPPVPLFEWQLWELNVAAMPLDHGFTCQFLAHFIEEFPTSPLIRIAVVVSGTEIVDTENGPVDCWKVEVTADSPWTVWIARDQKSAPIVQVEIRFPDHTDHWTREENV